MSTVREKAITAELMKDPAFRQAWDAFRRALAEGGLEDLADPDSPVRARMVSIEELLDARPDLAELVELADAEIH